MPEIVSPEIADLLNEKYIKFNSLDFIATDPICIPHRYSQKQDIEISGFFAAILAWGQRKTIINKCSELLEKMDNAPYEFVKNANSNEIKKLETFVHRTFNFVDLMYFLEFFKAHYTKHASLESAFLNKGNKDENLKMNLIHFKEYFFSLEDSPKRTQKHISSPASNSACKRINMYLRWMVRRDNKGVDFGIWNSILPSQLIIPCDIHVENIARKLKLTTRPKADWKMAEEITNTLRILDPEDPTKYDFALFGMGIEKYFGT
ncbi:MAG: TIGR02757 family protein [Leadbetterella sp.]|nr:TIGR02757 family protein [Leadbetterella sp.]